MARTLTKTAGKQATATRARRTSGRNTSIRTYRQALNFLNSKTNYEKMVRVGYNHTNFNLSRMNRILAELGNPHKELKTLHIAGTKGKGSTAHMLSSMLEASQERVGLYTSPHFLDIRERIRVNSTPVTESEFTKLIARMAPVAKKLEKENPTFFELMSAAAFCHFLDVKCDYAVIETGLGGRLDSTNVIKPEAIGITSISLDHAALLGDKLELIAEEKAGVFKPGVPVISAPQRPGVAKVLKQAAEKVGCDLRFVADDIEYSYRFESSRDFGPHTRVCMSTRTSRFDHLRVPLLGEHQALNCGVALGMIDCLRRAGADLDEQTAIDGLANCRPDGRIEIIHSHPRIVVDAAHNADSIAALMRGIGQNIGYDSMVVIFGCNSDKDIDGMLKQLTLGADKIIFTSSRTPRSADGADLLQRFQEKSPKMAQVADTLLDAYEIAKHCVTRDDLICVTGSVYLVGEAKRLQQKNAFQ